MKELRNIIAENLLGLRKKNKMTQAELAEKLNYSDKSVSKWENAESIPDIEILTKLSKLYGVSLDYFISEGIEKEKYVIEKPSKEVKNNKIIITLLSTLLVWFIATFIYVCLILISNLYYWKIFIWAISLSSVVLITFNGIWGKRKYMFFLISILLWSVILGLYLELIYYNLWPIFFIGIPGEFAIILWSQLKHNE